MPETVKEAVNAEVPCSSDYERTMLLLYYAFLLKGVPEKLNIFKEKVPELKQLWKLSPDLSKEQISSLISRAQDTLGDPFSRECAEQESLVSYYHKGVEEDPLIIWVDGLTSPGTWPLWTLFNVKRQVDACFDSQLRPGRYNIDVGLLVMKYPFHKEGLDPSILGGSTAQERLKLVLGEINQHSGNDSREGALKRPIILVGHSAGAQMVLELAKELKDQVKLVVPINVPYTFKDGAIHLALAVSGSMVKLFPSSQVIFNRWKRFFAPAEYHGAEPFDIVPHSHWITRVNPNISIGLFASITAVRLSMFKTLQSFSAPVCFINSDRDSLFNFGPLQRFLAQKFIRTSRFEFIELSSPHTPTTHYGESENLTNILAQKMVSLVEQNEVKEIRLLRSLMELGSLLNRMMTRVFGYLGELLKI